MEKQGIPRHLHNIVLRIIDNVEDEDPEDVLLACICLIVAIMKERPPKRRELLRPRVWGFFKALAEKKVK